jgi:prevent-host-death family protein
MVDTILRKDAEEAGNQLPDLLEAAEKGRSTIITRHGRPVAALVPIEAYGAAVRARPRRSAGGAAGCRQFRTHHLCDQGAPQIRAAA